MTARPSRVLVLGCGSVAQCTIPLLLDDLGIEPSQVGLDAAWSKVTSFEARPPRTAGTIVTDEGDGGVALATFLASRKFV